MRQNTYFLFQQIKTHSHTRKQTAKETKEYRKTKETQEEEEKENVVVLNNICRKSNGIGWYRLTICFLYF